MDRLLLFCAATAMVSACATMPRPERTIAFAEGDRVLADYQGSHVWWAGTVTSVNDGRYGITFDDGIADEVSAAEIEPLIWKRGSALTCNTNTGVVALIAPEARTLTLQAKDGYKIETTTASCYEDRRED